MGRLEQKYSWYVVLGDREYLTARKLAEDMEITTTTVAALVNHRDMPCRRIGNLFLFDADEVNAWIETQRPKRGRQRKADESAAE
jgi:excisionase family DNA binding protein